MEPPASKEEFVLKNVRVWFEKKDTARYISHLDLNRCMSRAFHKTKLPLWYTQGFHPHIFLTITMPLSLGMSGLRESMDIRLTEEIPYEEIIEKLNGALPLDIHVYEITEPVMKPCEVAFATYEITYEPENRSAQQAKEEIEELLSRQEVLVTKHTKRGPKEFDIRPYFADMKLEMGEDSFLHTHLCLPISVNGGVNPGLLKMAAERYLGLELYEQITRTGLYNEKMEPFQ